MVLITEQYPEYFLDLKDQMPDNWSNVVEPSKIATSFNSTGKQVIMPWGIALSCLLPITVLSKQISNYALGYSSYCFIL